MEVKNFETEIKERSVKAKEFEVEGRVFKVRQLLAIEFDELYNEDSKISVKNQIIRACDLSNFTEKDYNQLLMKERLIIQRVYNELNGFGDFQSSTQI